MNDPVSMWLLSLLYFVTLLLIGFWAARKIKSFDSYLVADRSLGFWVFTILMVASLSSGMALLGAAGLSYGTGWTSICDQIFVPCSLIVLLCLFGPKLHRIARRHNHLTLQDYFAHRFESPRFVRGVSGVAVVIISLIYLVGQYTAIGITMQRILGVSYPVGLLIGAVLVTVYVFLGGLYAVSWTTLLQGSILVLGVVAVGPLIVSRAGGLAEINRVLASVDPLLLHAAAPQQHPPVSPDMFFTPVFIASFGIMVCLGLSCAPHVINNVLAARKTEYFRWAPLAAFVIMSVFHHIVKWVGLAARSMAQDGRLSLPEGVANPTDFTFIVATESLTGPALQSFFAVLVLAAVMSTTDRLLLTIGGSCAWDLFRNLWKPSASDRQIMRTSRIAVVLSAFLSLVLALYPAELLAWLIWMGIGVMLAVFAAPLLGGLFWKRANGAGALAAMLAGLASAMVFGYIDQFVAKLPVHFSLGPFILAVLALAVFSLAGKRPSPHIIEQTDTGWRL
ncbi:MAG: sodium:solute symporter family protein [Acidobacteria bacterium]|nr:sodium:solute symporter family protein [Acidobacteriota bacterium]